MIYLTLSWGEGEKRGGEKRGKERRGGETKAS